MLDAAFSGIKLPARSYALTIIWIYKIAMCPLSNYLLPGYFFNDPLTTL